MSQEMYDQRLATVREAQNYQRNFGSIMAQSFSAAPNEVRTAVRNCCKTKNARTPVLLAPTELHTIQIDFERYKVGMRESKVNTVVEVKAAALATLMASQENLVATNPVAVTEHLQRVMAATTVQETAKAVQQAFREIKAQHTDAFVSNITVAVQESAAAIGFTDVKVVERNPEMVRILATNSAGQNMVTEISSQKQVDMRTELIGYTDGSCSKVIKAFDDELSKRGITTGSKTITPTHGVVQMPYAKRLLKKGRRVFADEEVSGVEEARNILTIKQ